MQAKERLFHRENEVDASISTRASKRIKKFAFSLCFRLCLRSLALCENETQHKNKEICHVRPTKALVPDSPRLSIAQNGGFDAYVDLRFHWHKQLMLVLVLTSLLKTFIDMLIT